jgi:hypothetical protein
MSDSALSVRYRRFRYQTQSDITDHSYRPTYENKDSYNFLILNKNYNDYLEAEVSGKC